MTEIDIDILREYAESALQRPSDAAFWDERCYSTHVPVIGWADRGDDILEESNFKVARDLIEGASEDDAHWFEGSASHWLVGNLEQVWVQVYEDSAPECEGHADEDWVLEYGGIAETQYCDGACQPREFTAAFKEAVSIQETLRDYAVLDDSDYSEREWKQYEEALKEAVEHAQRDYDDTCAEDDAISALWYEDDSNQHRSQWCCADDVSWETVAEEYREARDAYFTGKAQEIADELLKLGQLWKDGGWRCIGQLDLFGESA